MATTEPSMCNEIISESSLPRQTAYILMLTRYDLFIDSSSLHEETVFKTTILSAPVLIPLLEKTTGGL